MRASLKAALGDAAKDSDEVSWYKVDLGLLLGLQWGGGYVAVDEVDEALRASLKAALGDAAKDSDEVSWYKVELVLLLAWQWGGDVAAGEVDEALRASLKAALGDAAKDSDEVSWYQRTYIREGVLKAAAIHPHGLNTSGYLVSAYDYLNLLSCLI